MPPQEEEPGVTEPVTFEEEEITEDLADMRVPQREVEEMVPGSAGTLFEELDKEIGKSGR